MLLTASDGLQIRPNCSSFLAAKKVKFISILLVEKIQQHVCATTASFLIVKEGKNYTTDQNIHKSKN